MSTRTLWVTLIAWVAGVVCATPAFAQPDGAFMKLHETRWSINGKPILGTYGADRLEDLQKVRDAGMNLVLGGHKELDPKTPEGAFCLENGIKVMPHVTAFIYHGVSLRDPVDASQTMIPLHFAHGLITQESNIILLDEELIRYEAMTEEGLVNCERGYGGTSPASHREGTILFWPEACRGEIESIKDSPNLFGYYVLDDSPGDALSALRGLYKTIRDVDPNLDRPVCAGFGDAGSVANLAPGVCDIMMIYWYPVSTNRYYRERTAQEVQQMLSTARRRVPGIPFMGIYHAFDGRPANTGQGVPTAEQLREQLEDFVREGACGLVAFICYNAQLPGWAVLDDLGTTVRKASKEILETGGLRVRPETDLMKAQRIQPEGHWVTPKPLHGVVPAWYVVAPFEDTAGTGLDTPLPTEKSFNPSGVYPVKFGTATWRVRETTAGTLGLSDIYTGVKNGLAHAYCEVTSPVEQEVQLRVCTDDGGLVRLNGQEIYRFTGSRGLDFDKDIVPVTLPKGTSRLEVKCFNVASIWGFIVRFTDKEGRPLEGLTFSPTVP